MRNNKMVLDEAARSVRRTFIGSIAGSVVMLAVVGAAGAYGMPEKLTAQALTAAMTTLNVKFSPMLDRAAPIMERARAFAGSATGRTPAIQTAEISAPIPPRQDAVVRTLPERLAAAPVAEPIQMPPAPVVTQEQAPPIAREASIAAKPQDKPIAVMPMVEPVAAMPAVEPVAATPAALEPVVPVAADEPALPAMSEPARTAFASVTPAALTAPDENPLVSAPLIFETPKANGIPAFSVMPKTEPVVAAVPPSGPAATPVSAPVAQAGAIELPKPGDFSRSVWAHLLLAKPPLSPAQRLELHGKDYDKAEMCLAQAVYFEARNEPTRGQEAVAQVVLNRVFSPYYPKDVCSVVYQNAHRYLSCQFTFACDGKPESITEHGAWVRANRVARAALDAKVWLPDVDKATHYHAAYVRPNWIRDMRVMVRYGLHTFYRPRNWGDGSDEPHWGTATNSPKKGRV